MPSTSEVEEIRQDIDSMKNQLVAISDELRVHGEEEELRWQHLISVQELSAAAQTANTIAIAELTKGQVALTSSTQGLVDAWNAANTLQRFIKWIGSFGIVAVAASWAYTQYATAASKLLG